jgi:hypothetical protein
MNGNIYGYVSAYGAGQSYTYGTTLLNITDGTSNTMLFGENYARCGQTTNYALLYGYAPGSVYTYGSDRVWNYDPNSFTYTFTETYNFNSNPPFFSGSSSGSSAPVFYPYGSYNPATGQTVPFVVTPPAGQCDPQGIQGGTSAGALVSLCDGSVRLVSASISLNTWMAAGTTNAGDILGSDW